MATLLGGLIRLPAVRKQLACTDLPLLRPILLYLACTAVNCFTSIYPQRSFVHLTAECLEVFAAYYLFTVLVRRPMFWTSFRLCMLFAAAVICLISYIEIATAWSPWMSWFPEEEHIYREGMLRARSLFFHPIALGCFIVLAAPFLIIHFHDSRSKEVRALCVVLALMMGATLILTVSRGPLVGVLFEIAFVGFWAARARGVPLRQCVFVLVMLLIALPVLYQALPVAQSMFRPVVQFGNAEESSSEHYRIALAQAAISKLEGWRWIVGFGPGTFHLAEVTATYDGHNHVLTAPDSHYIKILFEYGLLGLGAFGGMLWTILVHGFRQVRTSPPARRIPVAAIYAAVVSFIFINVSVSLFPLLPLSFLFWISTAAMLSPDSQLHR